MTIRERYYLWGNKKRETKRLPLRQLGFPYLRQCNTNTAMKNNLYKYISEPYKKKEET